MDQVRMICVSCVMLAWSAVPAPADGAPAAAADLAARVLAGEAAAQREMGRRCAAGDGVARDEVRAANFFRLGAEQGDALCQYELGRCYEAGVGVKQSAQVAYLYYSVAAGHERLADAVGDAGAKAVAEAREGIMQAVTADEVAAVGPAVKAFRARVAVHPRRFGVEDVGASRGWFIWQSYDRDSRTARVTTDPPGEAWDVRVLPWATTYRYLNYGASPESLFPGERVNVFFDTDESNRRGYVSHFQDEVCQMKGHGHYWQVRTADAAAGRFTARVMHGDEPFNPAEADREFVIDATCTTWKDGRVVGRRALAAGDAVYLTWCFREKARVVMLISDAASLDAIQKAEGRRLAEECAAAGLAGRVEDADGDVAHVMLYATSWSQAGQIKEGQVVRVSGRAVRPATDLVGPPGDPWPTIEGRVTFRKNRGKYGSGVTDLVVKLKGAGDAAQARLWLGAEREVRVFPVAGAAGR